MVNFCIYVFIIYAVSNSAMIILFGGKKRRTARNTRKAKRTGNTQYRRNARTVTASRQAIRTAGKTNTPARRASQAAAYVRRRTKPIETKQIQNKKRRSTLRFCFG